MILTALLCGVQWFHIHRVLGVAAWIVGVIGAAFGQTILAANPIPSYHQVLMCLCIIGVVTIEWPQLCEISLINKMRRNDTEVAPHVWKGVECSTDSRGV